jgi:hypothetical protein
MKVAIGAGSGGGFPRGGALARPDSPALAITAASFVAVVGSLLGATLTLAPRCTGASRTADPAPRGLARLTLTPPRFSPVALDFARATPGRFARA